MSREEFKLTLKQNRLPFPHVIGWDSFWDSFWDSWDSQHPLTIMSSEITAWILNAFLIYSRALKKKDSAMAHYVVHVLYIP